MPAVQITILEVISIFLLYENAWNLEIENDKFLHKYLLYLLIARNVLKLYMG